MSTSSVLPPTPPPFTLDIPTILSLGFFFSLLPIAQGLASISLPQSNKTKPQNYTLSKTSYYLFIWCVFDVLTHTFVEGSYLYHCFFSYTTLPAPTSDHPHPASLGQPASRIAPGSFLGFNDRLYGAWYSNSPSARMWQEYAKADRRWGGADLTIISLEILTVFGAGPLAAYVAYLVSRIENARVTGKNVRVMKELQAKMYFVAIVLSTAELYGGFITFAPEWLSGNTLLDGKDDVIYFWLYLVVFNMLWVFVPVWILWVAWNGLVTGFVGESGDGGESEKVGKGKGRKSL